MEKFKNQYQIRATECDSNFNIRLSALWDLMQDAAAHHANILGFDHEEMVKNGNFFILVRMSANIKCYPKSGERIRVETYPAGMHKLFCVRRYEVFDEKDEKVAEATSLWIVVDCLTSRPLRPNKAYPDSPVTSFDYEGEICEKINIPEDLEFLRKVVAEFSDIDVNNHVNNARYINWIENMVRSGGEPIKSINVNYIQEIKLGEELDMFRNNDTIIIKDKEENVRFVAEVK